MQLPTTEPKNIYLVGMMGAGKSTIGKMLAKELNWNFVDIDHMIEERCGVRIPVIFEHEGELGFRRREAETLKLVLEQPQSVVATGGGVVTVDINRERLMAEPYVIYLKASAEDIYLRTKYDKNRPLLQTENPLLRIQELLEQRDPLYASVAKWVIHTEKQSAIKVIHKLTNIFEQYKRNEDEKN